MTARAVLVELPKYLLTKPLHCSAPVLYVVGYGVAITLGAGTGVGGGVVAMVGAGVEGAMATLSTFAGTLSETALLSAVLLRVEIPRAKATTGMANTILAFMIVIDLDSIPRP